VHEAGLAAFYRQAQEIAALKIGANVVLSDATGRQVMNTFRALGEPLAMHGNPAQLRAVFATGRPVVSDLYVGGVLRRPLISVDVPVIGDGKVAYALSIGVLPERFRTILNGQQLPPGWIGAVFDTTGTVVARTQEHERFVGGKGSAALVGRMAATAEGTLETVTLEGIPVVSVFSRSPVTGWTVALGIPRRDFTEQLLERSALAAGAALAVLGLGLGLAWRIGGSIAHSIRGLLEPAARIGRGESVAVPPLGLKEADEVGTALTGASRMIASAEHRAQHDMLTGLANRALFLEAAVRQVELCKRERTHSSILFIDLDGFKRVNDQHGHATGDRLLCAVAARLSNAVRGSDVAARLGGDEFAILLVHAETAVAAGIAAKLVDSLSEPYELEAHIVEVSASIGVAGFPESGATAEEVLQRADEAMYRAKVAGKRGHVVYGVPHGHGI
jgi:diguanylate cyclase (GGDEF)-like protein